MAVEQNTGKPENSVFDRATQVLLPLLTILGFLLTALKKPEIGLLINLTAQVFWINSAWQAWKKAGQIGIFITVMIVTMIIIFGIVNYWLL